MANEYAIGTLGHLLATYEPMFMTSLIIYEESDGTTPSKLVFDKHSRVHEHLRSRQIKAIYDSEDGGIVFIVSREKD